MVERESALAGRRSDPARVPTPQPHPGLCRARHHRAGLLWQFSDPEDAASLRRVGTILEELLDSSEQRGLETDDYQIRPAVLAVIQDLLAGAANLAAIAERRAWDGDISSEEFALAMRADAWAYQVKALAASFRHELGEPAPGEGATG